MSSFKEFFQDSSGKFSRTAVRLYSGLLLSHYVVLAWVFRPDHPPPEAMLWFIAGIIGIDTGMYIFQKRADNELRINTNTRQNNNNNESPPSNG